MIALRGLAAILFACVLASCGGGGGGSGSSSSSSSSSGSGGGSGRGQFTLSGTSASFSAYAGLTTAPAQSFAMTITGSDVAAVGAAYAQGQTPAQWLNISMTGSGNNYTLTVQPVAGIALAQGTHTAAFTVGTADSSGNVLRTQVFTVTYALQWRIEVTSPSSPVDRSYTFGAASRTENLPLNVTAPNRQWTLSSDAGWLRVPAGAQNGTATANATIDVTGLAPGGYTGTITLTNSALPSDTTTTQVRVNINPAAFDVADTGFTFGGDDGRATPSAQQLDFSLAAGDGVHPFVISTSTDSGGQWLNVDRPTGTVGANGTSVALGVDRGTLAGGTYTGEVTVSTDVYGVVFSETIPVTLNLEAHRIVVSASGVALSRVAGREVLTRRLEVYSNLGLASTQWTAASDAAWLSVTASGNVGDDLVLTATPAALALAADTTHFANVTISSPTASVENTQSVRVGFYRSNTAPVDAAVMQDTRSVAASPVEPLFAAATPAGVRLINAYTNAVVRTIGASITEPGQMVFAEDGRTLFVHDTTLLRVSEFNVTTGAVVRHFDAPLRDGTNPVFAKAISVAHPDGHPMLVTPNIHFHDLATGNGMSIGGWSSLEFNGLAVSPDQTLLVKEAGGAIRIARTALEGGGLRFDPNYWQFPINATSRDSCVNPAGTIIYAGAQDVGPNVLAGATIEPRAVLHRWPATWFTLAVECTWNGLVVGAFHASGDFFDISVFAESTGALLAQRNSDLSSGAFIPNRIILERGMAVSGDGTRMLTTWLTGTSFFPVGYAAQTLPAAP